MPESEPTDWKPSPAVEDYRSRPRAVSTPEGKKRRLPKLRYERWCKPCGNLVRIAIESTRDQEAPGRAAYTDVEHRRQVNAGSFPWVYEICRMLAPSYVVNMTEAQWHVERERLLQERRKAHEAQQISIDTGDEQIARALEGNTAAVTRMVEMVSEQMTKTRKQNA